MAAEFTSHEFPPHTHDAFVVAATESGGSQIKSRGDVSDADPTGLFVFNPEEPQAGWMGRSTHWEYRAFYMAKPAMVMLANDLGLPELPYFLRNRFTDRDLIDGFLTLHRALDGPADLMGTRQLTIEIFERLFARYGSGRRPACSNVHDKERVRTATDLMRVRYGEPLTLDDLSEALGVTNYQLIGLFKRTIGITPHSYLIQVRLGAACRLLKGGTAIADTAAACGFYDQSALTKQFKRCYALTPLQFGQAFVHRKSQDATSTQF
jgi:AraC-like DNA-binding protein